MFLWQMLLRLEPFPTRLVWLCFLDVDPPITLGVRTLLKDTSYVWPLIGHGSLWLKWKATSSALQECIAGLFVYRISSLSFESKCPTSNQISYIASILRNMYLTALKFTVSFLYRGLMARYCGLLTFYTCTYVQDCACITKINLTNGC